MTDDYLPELRRTRAYLRLRMYEGLLSTLDKNAAYALLLLDADEARPSDARPLRASGHYQPTEPEQALARGRIALLKAAAVSPRAWEAMPACSAERSAVLLRGAAALGIETTWKGWES